MNTLARGSLKGREDFFDALIEFSNFRSEQTIKLLKKHFVDGYTIEGLITLLNADSGNVYRDVKKLKKFANRYERLKDVDLKRFHLVPKR